jgi:DUF1365 family protein
MSDSCLYFGQVLHRRVRPFQHRFRYRVFSIYLDLDELPNVAHRLKLFSYNRWNLFSFFDRDHGPLGPAAQEKRPIRAWVDQNLAAAGIDCHGGRITLLCFPRLFGFVFNPLSVFFCHNRNGDLKAILYEVSNTFSQRHSYLLPCDDGARRNAPVAINQSCAKRLYVSPFIGMASTYRFRIKVPDERLSILVRQAIQEQSNESRQLVAVQTGQRVPLTDPNLIRAFFRYPLMTVKVVAAIHWEALWLWRKGARLVSRPQPPKHEVTLTNNTGSEIPLLANTRAEGSAR